MIKSPFWKKNWYFIVPVLIIAIPALLTAWYVKSFGYSWSEAWSAVQHFGQTRTRYAQKFSESQLNRIRPGMKGDEVFKLIGQPFEGHIVNGRPGPIWKYSLPKGDAQYFHERAVLFDLPPGKPPTVKSIVRQLHQPGTSLPQP
jgi:hypothetical protein